MANVNVLLDAERVRSAELRDRILKLSTNLVSVKRTLITGKKHSREERADSVAAERLMSGAPPKVGCTLSLSGTNPIVAVTSEHRRLPF